MARTEGGKALLKIDVARVLKKLSVPEKKIEKLTGLSPTIIKKLLPLDVSDETKQTIVELLEGEVSYDELAMLIGESRSDWEKEIFVLDKSFVEETTGKILTVSISDLHEPYGLANTADFICEVYKEYVSPKILVINGDLFDMDVATSMKSHDYKQFESVYYNVLDMVTILAANFDLVLITKGNHDEFLRRKIMKDKTLTPFHFMMGDVLAFIASGYGFDSNGMPEKQRDLSNVHYGGTQAIKIGDVIFQHPNNYSRSLVRRAEQACAYWLERDRDVKVIVSGHTHSQGRVKGHGGIWYFEQGCLAGRADYLVRSLTTTKKLPDIGFCQLWLDENLHYVDNSYKEILLNGYIHKSPYFNNLYYPDLESLL